MADKKITQLPVSTTIAGTDLLVFVFDALGVAVTKSITFSNLQLNSSNPNPPVIYIADPNVEALTPIDISKPCVAYSNDGSLAMYGWNTVSHIWQ